MRRKRPKAPQPRSTSERARPLRPRNVYIAFGAIAIGTALVSTLFAEVEAVDRFGPNLASEAIGILLTLIFVQRFLDRQERLRRLRGSIGALRKGGRALASMAQAWGALIKGGYRKPPPHPPESVANLFAPHVNENIVNVDPLRERTSGIGDAERWIERVYREVIAAQQTLHEIVIAYGASLDASYVEAIDELVDDPFPRMLGDVISEPGLDARRWRVRLNAMRALREQHFSRLVQAIELHNEIAREASMVRSRRSAPRTGALGVELPLDWDLRARFVLDDGWWRSEPRPGSLCLDEERRSTG